MKNLFEVEAAIIGAIIDRPELFLKLNEKLSPSDFSPQSRLIFTAIKELFSETGKVDFPSLLNKLNKKVDASVLKAIAEYGSFTVDVDNAAELLKKASLKRKLESALSGTLKQLSQNAEPEEIARKLEYTLCQILSQKYRYNPEIPDLLTEYELFVRELKRNPWLPLPFTRIQQAIGGIIPGTFWILGGYTSRGKTSTVVELATYLLKKDAVVVHFSLEEERKLTVSRYLANLTGIPILAQLKEKLNGEAARTLEDAKTYLSSKSLYIYDDVFDLQDIYFRSQFVQTEKGKIDLIIIDYIQLVRIHGCRNLTEKMDAAAITFREISKRLNTTVIAISQIGREYTRESAAIGFKGSGGLEAACDIGLWIDPVPDKERQFYLKLRKHRLGPTGIFLMEFANTFTSVREVNDKNTKNGFDKTPGQIETSIDESREFFEEDLEEIDEY